MRQSKSAAPAVPGVREPAANATIKHSTSTRVILGPLMSFLSAGEGQRPLQPLIGLQQILSNTRVGALGRSLRAAKRQAADPAGDLPVARDQLGQARPATPVHRKQLVLERHHGLIAARIALAPAA